MREIKFRGYNRKNKQWLYGFYLQNRGAHFVCPDEFANGKGWDDYEIDPATLGQLTGFTDMHGHEIYEGDVIREWDDAIQRWYAAEHVAFDNGCFSIAGDNRYYPMEVIGNIHDNPELLKR